jgi:hypothetical protein
MPGLYSIKATAASDFRCMPDGNFRPGLLGLNSQEAFKLTLVKLKTMEVSPFRK